MNILFWIAIVIAWIGCGRWAHCLIKNLFIKIFQQSLGDEAWDSRTRRISILLVLFGPIFLVSAFIILMIERDEK